MQVNFRGTSILSPSLPIHSCDWGNHWCDYFHQDYFAGNRGKIGAGTKTPKGDPSTGKDFFGWNTDPCVRISPVKTDQFGRHVPVYLIQKYPLPPPPLPGELNLNCIGSFVTYYSFNAENSLFTMLNILQFSFWLVSGRSKWSRKALNTAPISGVRSIVSDRIADEWRWCVAGLTHSERRPQNIYSQEEINLYCFIK